MDVKLVCLSTQIKHLCAISEKGGMITTQTQLLMITHPLLILVCQLVEAELSITDKLFCTLEPQEEKEGEDGGEEGEESDVKRELLYFGQVPMAVHEVDVNVARDRLRSKGLVGCSHIFSDYPPKFVNNLLLIVTDVSGATEVLGMMRGVEYPITYKSFNLLKSASLMKPLVVIEECVDFVNYVAGWIRSFVPDGGK